MRQQSTTPISYVAQIGGPTAITLAINHSVFIELSVLSKDFRTQDGIYRPQRGYIIKCPAGSPATHTGNPGTNRFFVQGTPWQKLPKPIRAILDILGNHLSHRPVIKNPYRLSCARTRQNVRPRTHRPAVICVDFGG